MSRDPRTGRTCSQHLRLGSALTLTALAGLLATSSPEAMTRIRHSIDDAFSNPLGRQLDLEMEHQAVLIPRNMAEGAAAFRERREPAFDGRRAQAQ